MTNEIITPIESLINLINNHNTGIITLILRTTNDNIEKIDLPLTFFQELNMDEKGYVQIDFKGFMTAFSFNKWDLISVEFKGDDTE